MPLNLPNWMQAPMQQDAYKGIGDFAQNAIGAYYGVQNHQKEQEKAAQEMMLGKQKLVAGDITNKYLERLKRAEIEKLESEAQYNKERERKSGGKSPALSPSAKLANERIDIDNGFIPGTNQQQRFSSPEEQARFAELNDMAMQKQTSSPNTLEKALFARNVNKLMDMSNVDNLVAYSGVGGATQLAFQKGLDAVSPNLSSETFKKYQEELTKVELEAKEIRQFFGDSIRGPVTDALKQLTNPTSWGTSPETAKRKISALRKVIKAQMETFENAAYGKHRRGDKGSTEDRRERNNRALRDLIKNGAEGNENEMIKGTDDEDNEYTVPLREVERFVKKGGWIVD